MSESPYNRGRDRARGHGRDTAGDGHRRHHERERSPPSAYLPPKRSAPEPGGVWVPPVSSSAGTSRDPSASKPGGPTSEGARGAIRGRRVMNEVVRTRAENLVTKQGTTGNPVRLTTNYFRLLKKPTWCLYQYHVDFSAEELPRVVRKGLLRVHRELLGNHIFDGSTLFLTRRMAEDMVEVFSKNRAEEQIKLTIKLTGVVSMSESRSLQVLNIIIRKALEGLKLQLVGRNFFDALAKVTIREFNLELWPGYVTSMRQHEKDILLCAEISHKVMRTDTVYDILSRCTQQSRGGDWRDGFMKAVIGMIVLTDYNNQFYRVDDVDFSTTPSATFETKAGPTSFVDYYKKKYNIRIHDERQPLLISRAKAKDVRAGRSETVALIPELCRATGITEEMRSNFQLMRAMGEYTRVGPELRIRKLLQFNQRLARTPESVNVFKEWQLTLDSNLVELPGRELKNETIVFGRGSRIPTDRNADWTQSLKSQALFMCEDLRNWHLIAPERNMRESQDFLRCLQDAGKGMGFRIDNPTIVSIPDDRSPTYVTALENCANGDPQLIMCITPNNRADRYSAIKKKCCLDRAIPTQVMLAKTVTPKRGANPRTLMSVATKVAIQLNCKLGYAPWMIEIPLSGLMTIGYDVCRDTSNKAKSYGALVATMDLRTNCKYFSVVTPHANGEELSNEIATNVAKALKEYRRMHGTLPSKIVFYRDGLGEGQLQFVVDHEVNILKTKLEQIYKSAKVEAGYSFGFIVVNKRVNSRFFKDNRFNPAPGTVIDDIVTLPESYDFFLVSQSSRQGTVAPTYYNVLSENLRLPADKIQILTYKQCHLYYNWPGTTRVPAVCQYAHKLAFLVSQFIHASPSNLLEKQLYYL